MFGLDQDKLKSKVVGKMATVALILALVGLVAIGTQHGSQPEGSLKHKNMVKSTDVEQSSDKMMAKAVSAPVWVNKDSEPSAILTGLGGYATMKSTIEAHGCPNFIFKPTTGNNPYPSIVPSLGCEVTSNHVKLFGHMLHAGVWSLHYVVTVTSSGSLSCCNWHHKPVGGLGPGTCYDPDGCQMSKIFMAVNHNLPMTARPLNFAQLRSLIVNGNMCPQQLIMKSADGKQYTLTNSGNCGTRLNRVGITFWTKFSTGAYGQVLLESTTWNTFFVFQVQTFGADGTRGAEKTLINFGSVDVSIYFPTVPSPFVVSMATSNFEVVY